MLTSVVEFLNNLTKEQKEKLRSYLKTENNFTKEILTEISREFKEIDGYLIDKDNNNKYLISSDVSRKEVINKLKSLKNCKNCINCYNCSDCYNCSNCSNCSNCYCCHHCTNCSNCCYCHHCTNCFNCFCCFDCCYCSKSSNLYRISNIKDNIHEPKNSQ